MDTHVKIVAIIHILSGAIGALFALVMFMVFGGVTAIVGASAPGNEAMIAMPILMMIGGFLTLLIGILSLPSLIGGIALLNYAQWARVVLIIVSILGLLNFPIGTAIGIYSLIILLNAETGQLFDQGGPARMNHSYNQQPPQSPPPQNPPAGA